MPLAFIASSDEESEVASLWGDVWSEASASEAAALRLYMPEILPLLLEGEYPVEVWHVIQITGLDKLVRHNWTCITNTAPHGMAV